MLRRVIHYFDENVTFSFNFLETLVLLRTSSNNVSQETIENCLRKSSIFITNDDLMPTESDDEI